MASVGERIRIVEGPAEIAAVLAGFGRSAAATAFQDPAWLGCWLAGAARDGRRVIAAVAEDPSDGSPRLALPLALDQRGAMPAWTGFDFGLTDYNLPIAAADFRPCAAAVTRLWRGIVAALPKGASYLLLDKLPLAVAGRPTVFADLADLRHSQVIRHPLALDRDFEALRATRFSQTMVHSLDRKRRKLERKGRFEVRVATGEAALPVFERLVAWRDERFGAHPETNDFWRRLVEAGDPARVFSLHLDEEPVSACLGVADGSGLRLLAVAHDARFNNWSPGLLVIEDAIRLAIAEGFAEFDFTIGCESYKTDFGVEPQPMGLLAAAFDAQGAAMIRLLSARAYVAARLRRRLDAMHLGGGHHRRLAASG